MSIVIPLAEIAGGRAPQVRVEADETARVVGEFGARVAQIGEALETDRLDREMAQARIDMTRRLGEARQAFASSNDPDAINDPERPDGWIATRRALRDELVAGSDKRIAETVGMAFDELADQHGLALGARAIDLANGQWRVLLDNQGREAVAQGATADPETRAALLGQYADTVAAALEDGAISAEEANTLLNSQRDALVRTAALRRLVEDPAGLIAALDGGEMAGIDPVYAEGLRARAASAVAQEAARGAAEAERAAKARETEIGDRLGDIAANAWDARLTAWEQDMLGDPEVQAHPKFPEAQAAITLRDTLPEFATLPPARQAELIAAEKARPIGERYETKVLAAMEARHAADKAGWAKDPIAQAATLGLTPPPPLPALSADPAELAPALAARRGYGLSLRKAGYVEQPAFFSVEERAALQEATAADQDPAARARLAASIIAGFGPEAPRALAEIGGDDVFAHAGALAATTRNPALAQEAFKGQQMIEQKLVQLPPQADRTGWVDATFGTLFEGDPVTEGRIIRTAEAIYAARSRGSEPDERLYAQALNAALGAGVDAKGNQTGGVQRVRRTDTLLPLDVTADAVEAGLDAAAARLEAGGADALAPWRAASVSGGAPSYAGEPLSAEVLGRVKLRAVGNDVYELYVERRGQQFDVIDDASGAPYTMRLTRLLGGLAP